MSTCELSLSTSLEVGPPSEVPCVTFVEPSVVALDVAAYDVVEPCSLAVVAPPVEPLLSTDVSEDPVPREDADAVPLEVSTEEAPGGSVGHAVTANNRIEAVPEQRTAHSLAD